MLLDAVDIAAHVYAHQFHHIAYYALFLPQNNNNFFFCTKLEIINKITTLCYTIN